jgi:aryl-alcohol dehydrogenase-like predicted oxidoreductase
MGGQSPAELVIGSAQLGLNYGAANRTGKPARGVALTLLRRAADAGVTSFDTARSYGDAEERLGEALAGRKVRTTTKLAPLVELKPGASLEAVRAAVDKSVADSAAALKRGRLDCLLLHRAAHMTAFDGAIWERLHEHLKEGTIGSLGVSVQNPADALEALAQPSVQHLQLPFNVFDWRWRGAGVLAAIARRKDVTVHARSVFLQGVLAAEDPLAWPRVPGVDAPALVTWLNHEANGFGCDSAADLCLAYVRGQHWIDGVVVGMETEEQLEANLALAARRPLGVEDCAALESRCPRLPAQFLDPAQWPPR